MQTLLRQLTPACALLAATCFSSLAVSQADATKNTEAEVRSAVLESFNRIRKTREITPDGTPEFALNSNGSLLQYTPREQGQVQRFDHFNLAPSNIHVTTLIEGKAAVAMFYSSGSVQFQGAPMIRGYRTRVSQTWVNGDDGWTLKTSHYSPMAGGDGIATALEDSMKAQEEGGATTTPVIHSAREALPDNAMSQALEKRIDFVFQHWREKHRGFAGANGLHAFNSNGGMLAHLSPVQVVEFPLSTVQPRDVHIIPLVDGEAAVAMFYAEGSLQVEGGPLVSNYRTRVSQTFVKEFGRWHCKTEHWSKLAGSDGVEPAKVAAEVTPEPADKSAYSKDCAEIDAVMHSVRMFVSGNIDAWRACYDDDAMWTHNQWGGNRPIDALADIHRKFHEAVESVAVTNYSFECVTDADGQKAVHSWINFRAKYKSGEVDERCGAFTVRIGENNLFTYEVGLYDTAGMPGSAPYGEPEKGDK